MEAEKLGIDEKLLEKIYEEIKVKTKNSDIYKKLTRRKYRPVKGYENWLDIILEFAIALDGTAKGRITLNPLMMLTVQLVNNYHVKNSPSYWLDKNLAAILSNCDVPDGVSELPSSIPHGLILLPRSYAPVDKHGESINWILFSKMKAGEQFPAIFYGNKYAVNEPIEKDCILWVSQTKSTALYSGGITQDFQYHSVNPSGITPDEEDKSLAQQASNLLLQSLLIAQWYPEYTETVDSGVGFSPLKMQRSAKKENAWLNPKWIGDLYKKNVRSTPKGGTHANPIGHIRRGHWRNQACGKNWSERKMILIEPTEVSFHLEKSKHVS